MHNWNLRLVSTVRRELSLLYSFIFFSLSSHFVHLLYTYALKYKATDIWTASHLTIFKMPVSLPKSFRVNIILPYWKLERWECKTSAKTETKHTKNMNKPKRKSLILSRKLLNIYCKDVCSCLIKHKSSLVRCEKCRLPRLYTEVGVSTEAFDVSV